MTSSHMGTGTPQTSTDDASRLPVTMTMNAIRPTQTAILGSAELLEEVNGSAY